MQSNPVIMGTVGTRKSVGITVRVSLLRGLILRKMYGAGPRKLSTITSVRKVWFHCINFDPRLCKVSEP